MKYEVTTCNLFCFKVGGSKPALDMAIMAACNHSLVDYGTFSVWGAYLAQGEVVVANYHRYDEHCTHIVRENRAKNFVWGWVAGCVGV